MTREEQKEGLGCSANDGAQFWLPVWAELPNRGRQAIFIACVDGRKGFPQARVTVSPQITRPGTVDSILVGKRCSIHDRDSLVTTNFLSLLAEVGVELVKLSPHSPNLNNCAERFVRSIKESCLDRLILFGDDSLRKAVSEFAAH